MKTNPPVLMKTTMFVQWLGTYICTVIIAHHNKLDDQIGAIVRVDIDRQFLMLNLMVWLLDQFIK